MNLAHRNFNFPKKEKLTGKKLIEELFKDGSSFYNHPIRLKYLSTDEYHYNRVLITVPKKNQSRAVDRNLTKRRIREAYRLNKNILLDSSEKRYLLAIMYLSNEILSYKEIEDKLIQLLHRLSKNKKGKSV